MSPISSSSRLPPSAAWNSPRWFASAPVKAPFTWPNSSDSSSASGIALQFTATKGRPARGLARWMAWASSSLPVPLSPRSSTLASERATILASASSSFIPLERLTMPSRHASPSSAVSPAAADSASAWAILSSSALPSNGLVR